MKNTRHYEITFFGKKIFAFLLAGTLVFVPGCSNKNNYHNKYIAENMLPDENDLEISFEDTYEYVVQNGEGVRLFNSEDIRLFYDPESGVKRAYLFYKGHDGLYIFTLPNGHLEMIYKPFDFGKYYIDPGHYEYIEMNSIGLGDAYKYIEDFQLQASYSEEDISELIREYAAGVDIINSAMSMGKKN